MTKSDGKAVKLNFKFYSQMKPIARRCSWCNGYRRRK